MVELFIKGNHSISRKETVQIYFRICGGAVMVVVVCFCGLTPNFVHFVLLRLKLKPCASSVI